jgi:hypothetical protein
LSQRNSFGIDFDFWNGFNHFHSTMDGIFIAFIYFL